MMAKKESMPSQIRVKCDTYARMHAEVYHKIASIYGQAASAARKKPVHTVANIRLATMRQILHALRPIEHRTS